MGRPHSVPYPSARGCGGPLGRRWEAAMQTISTLEHAILAFIGGFVLGTMLGLAILLLFYAVRVFE